jgi:hypothetical protein
MPCQLFPPPKIAEKKKICEKAAADIIQRKLLVE